MSHHHHAHDHSACSHHHTPTQYGRAFIIGLALNIIFVVVEVYFGLISKSMALLADAGHNLSDCAGLVLAGVAYFLSKRPPTAHFSYGWHAAPILAALVNAVFLLIATLWIGFEAISRLLSDMPPEVKGDMVMGVAAAGVLINGVSALLFRAGAKQDANMRGAYLHLAADAAVSFGVVISGAIISATGWVWVDSITSILITVVILRVSWSLLLQTWRMSLQAAPDTIDPQAVHDFLSEQLGVREVHDLHIWPIGTRDIALSVHLVMPSGHPGDEWLRNLDYQLRAHFGVTHTAIQVELGDTDVECPYAPPHAL